MSQQEPNKAVPDYLTGVAISLLNVLRLVSAYSERSRLAMQPSICLQSTVKSCERYSDIFKPWRSQNKSCMSMHHIVQHKCAHIGVDVNIMYRNVCVSVHVCSDVFADTNSTTKRGTCASQLQASMQVPTPMCTACSQATNTGFNGCPQSVHSMLLSMIG